MLARSFSRTKRHLCREAQEMSEPFRPKAAVRWPSQTTLTSSLLKSKSQHTAKSSFSRASAWDCSSRACLLLAGRAALTGTVQTVLPLPKPGTQRCGHGCQHKSGSASHEAPESCQISGIRHTYIRGPLSEENSQWKITITLFSKLKGAIGFLRRNSSTSRSRGRFTAPCGGEAVPGRASQPSIATLAQVICTLAHKHPTGLEHHQGMAKHRKGCRPQNVPGQRGHFSLWKQLTTQHGKPVLGLFQLLLPPDAAPLGTRLAKGSCSV